jgi:hypothetical protein
MLRWFRHYVGLENNSTNQQINKSTTSNIPPSVSPPKLRGENFIEVV